MNFTHAIVIDGEVYRKFRWSPREAKWYRDSHPDVEVINLPREKIKPFNTNDYEEAPF